MAYTLTQARPLLTAAELELFEQSRTEPVKRLTPADLAGAVKRTRTLRDKSRDLYRRQTVSVRTDAPGAVTGDDNERTQRKADILQEVLERYEARVTLLQERGSSNTGSKDKGSGASDKAAAKGSTAQKVKATSPKTSRASTTAESAAAPSAPPDASTSVEKAEKKDAGIASVHKAGSAPARSSKAPSRKAPTANHKAEAPDIKAPLDTVPAAERASPLKQDPGNIAIHAHQSSSGRRTQGKRDSR